MLSQNWASSQSSDAAAAISGSKDFPLREFAASLAAVRPRSEKKTYMIIATLTMRPASGVSSPRHLCGPLPSQDSQML